MRSIFDTGGEVCYMENRDGAIFIYQRPNLRVVKVTVVDKDKKLVPVPTIFQGCRKHMEGEQGADYAGLTAAFWLMHAGPQGHTVMRTSFEVGMVLGIMAERARINRGAKVTTEITEMTADQFDAEEKRLKAHE